MAFPFRWVNSKFTRILRFREGRLEPALVKGKGFM